VTRALLLLLPLPPLLPLLPAPSSLLPPAYTCCVFSAIKSVMFGYSAA
jgi:hypothetical protein